MIRGEAHDLAPPSGGTRGVDRRQDDIIDVGLAAAERRKAVLEDDDVVVRWDLGQPVRGGRTERALVGRRQEGS